MKKDDRTAVDAYKLNRHQDEDDWEPMLVDEFPSANQPLTTTITVRLSQSEADLVRQFAKQRRMTFSDVIRQSIRTCALRPTFYGTNEDIRIPVQPAPNQPHRFFGTLFEQPVQSGSPRLEKQPA